MNDPTERTRQLDIPAQASAADESKADGHPANDNAVPPLVVLHPTGDGALLYRALARVLVRRELNFANAILEGDRCEIEKAAG